LLILLRGFLLGDFDSLYASFREPGSDRLLAARNLLARLAALSVRFFAFFTARFTELAAFLPYLALAVVPTWNVICFSTPFRTERKLFANHAPYPRNPFHFCFCSEAGR
jgi:hypothetical protein